MADQLINLERNQTRRSDDCKVLRPSLPEQQPDPFGNQQGRIEERPHTRGFELVRSHSDHSTERGVDQPVIRIDAQYFDPVREHRRSVVMQKLERARSRQHQSQPLHQL